MNKVIARQLEELEEQASQIDASKRVQDNEIFGGGEYVDDDLLLKWKVKVRSLLSKLCGEDSQYFKQFEEEEQSGIVGTTNFEIFKRLKSIFSAAKEDFGDGYLSSVRELLHAETFADFLEMADHLLSEGYKDAAAVIAGSSLEVHLRNLAAKHNLAVELNGKPKKADQINSDLASASAYLKLDQKNVTAWLDLRNKAAHGHYGDYNSTQVSLLVRHIRDFMVRIPA